MGDKECLKQPEGTYHEQQKKKKLLRRETDPIKKGGSALVAEEHSKLGLTPIILWRNLASLLRAQFAEAKREGGYDERLVAAE